MIDAAVEQDDREEQRFGRFTDIVANLRGDETTCFEH